MLSLIVPTRNRCSSLADLCNSLLYQKLKSEKFEVIIVDNGSSDKTHDVCMNYEKKIKNFKYFYIEEPGLHIGRHLGAKFARGSVLVYCDDDIIASSGWLKSIHKAFKDATVAVVGGKVLPKWEGEAPDWLDQFKTSTSQGWHLGFLSLLDFGDQIMDFNPRFVFGCNYSIRKEALYSCGGFHPDAMPQDLIRYRGDGETGLSRKILEKKLRSVYVPEAMVYHRVPAERLTVEYFCQRAFNQGVSDSYSEIRSKGGLSTTTSWKKSIRAVRDAGKMKIAPITLLTKRLLSRTAEESYDIALKLKEAHRDGYAFHRKEVLGDPELLGHVLQETYF